MQRFLGLIPKNFYAYVFLGILKGRGKKMTNYVPKEKDIVLIDFSPVKGHEQDGKRPALVISNKLFNNFTKMAVVCPMSLNTKYFPTHYVLKKSKNIKGAVLCEHIRSIDYKKRKMEYVDSISDKEYEDIIDLINSFLEVEDYV